MSEANILLIDSELPDTYGVGVFNRIQFKNPETRAILIAGYQIEQFIAEVVRSRCRDITCAVKIRAAFKNPLGQIRNQSVVFAVGSDPDIGQKITQHLTKQ